MCGGAPPDRALVVSDQPLRGGTPPPPRIRFILAEAHGPARYEWHNPDLATIRDRTISLHPDRMAEVS